MTTQETGSSELDLTPNWQEYGLLVPVVNPANVDELMRTAWAIAADHNGEIIVLTVLTVENPESVSLDDSLIGDRRELLDRALDVDPDLRETAVPVSGLIKAGPDPAATILSTARQYDVDTILLGWDGGPAPLSELIFGSVVDTVAASADCDVLVERVGGHPETVGPILAPIAGGPHLPLTVDTAGSLARAYDTRATLVSVVGPRATRDERDAREETLDTAAERLDTVAVETRLLEGQNIAETIIAETSYHDLTVLGATGKGRLEELVFDSVTAQIVRGSATPVIVAKRPRGPSRMSRLSRWFATRFAH